MMTRARSAAVVVAAAALIGATVHAARSTSHMTSSTSHVARSTSHVIPMRLADTGFGDAGNRPFVPQYPLWSDGLQKSRWVYLPPGTTIDTSDPDDWDFPVGTRFWKEFRLGDRMVETRMIWKAGPGAWRFATYVWNEAGTDAVLAPEEGVPGAVELAPGRRHSIPSRTDCTACHGTKSVRPLGFNALQLSTDRDPNAIHGEPLGPGRLTLKELVNEGFLTQGSWLSAPPRIQTSNPKTRAVLGYLAANCGTCHNGRGEISALGPVIRYADLLQDGDKVAKSLVGQLTRWQLPGQPDGTTELVHPGSPEQSALLARMRSRSPSSQMPPLGTVLRDQKAVDAIARWIAVDLVGR